MLSFVWRRLDSRPASDASATASMTDHNPDLQVRDLLSDPALRSAMGLDGEGEAAAVSALATGS